MSGMKGLNGKVRCPSTKHAVCDYTNLRGGIQVVSNFSSKLGLPNIETVESIDANHMQMARCKDRSDESYRFIAGVLKHFLRKTLPHVESPARPVRQTQRKVTSIRAHKVDAR